MGRALICMGVGAVLLGMAATSFVVHHSRDLAGVDETGLELDPPSPSPGRNAFRDLFEASRLLDWPDEEAASRVRALARFDGWDPDAARDLLERNREALDALGRALERSELEISTAELSIDPEGNEPPPFVLWRSLIELQNLRGALRLHEGDPEGALEDALSGLRLGSRLLSARGAGLVHAMLGLALGRSALEQLEAQLGRASLRADAARRAIREIESAREGDAWARIWAYEYREMRDALVSAFESSADGPWLPSSYVLQPNRTLQSLADLFRRQKSNSVLPCDEMESISRDRTRSPLSRARLYLGPNSIGNILIEIAAPSYDGFHRNRCAFESRASAMQAAIALRARLDARGELPAALEELVPELLDAVPLDGFRGEPLHYSRDLRELGSSTGCERWPLPF